MKPNTTYDRIKLVNFLHKVPRFSYPDNVEIILTEDRWDYVLGTLLLPAGLAILFLIWATVLVISKCTAVQPRDRKPSEEKKRTESKCRTTSLLAFLWSFIFMAICSFLYTSQGALKTKESFYRISEEVKEFEEIANRLNEIMLSLMSLQEEATSSSDELIEILNSILYNDVYNNIVDGLDNFGENVIGAISDADGAPLDGKIGEVDTYADIIDALLKNASKYDDIEGLDEFIMEGGLDAFIMEGVNASKFDEIEEIDEVIAMLGIHASELDEIEEIHNIIADIDTDTLNHDEIEMLDAEIENTDLDTIIADMSINASNHGDIEGLNTTIAGVSMERSNYDERDETDKSGGFRSLLSHFDTQLLKDDKVNEAGRALAHLGMHISRVRELKNVDTKDSGTGKYRDIYELINKTIEELSSLSKFSEFVLLDSSSVFEKITSVIFGVKKNLIKLGNYVQMTSFGTFPVLFLPLCLVVGLGIGCTRDQPSNIDNTYGSFLSWLVLPIFILIIFFCIISFTVLGFVAIVTADVCVSKEGLITKVMVEKGMESTDFFYLMMEYYIMSSCLRPSMIGIDHLILQIEQAIADTDTLSLTMDTVCKFVDCATINKLVNTLVKVLNAVTMELMATGEIIGCEGIHSIYSVIVRDEMCANSLTGVVWMYSMLLLISIFGMVMITLRNVVWINLAAKIAPNATAEELANLATSISLNTGGNNNIMPPSLVSGGTNTARDSFVSNRGSQKREIMGESQNSKYGSKNDLMNKDRHSIATEERDSNHRRHIHSFVSNRGRQRSRTKPKYNINREIVRESQSSNYSSKNDSLKTKDWDYTTTSKSGSKVGSHSPNTGSKNNRSKPKRNTNREIVRENQNSKHSIKNDSVKTKDWDYTTTSERGSNSGSHNFVANRGSKKNGTEPEYNQHKNTRRDSELKAQQQSSTKVILGGSLE